LCFGSVLAPASATTVVGANPPFVIFGSAVGTNLRNSTCNSPATNCRDRTYLEVNLLWAGVHRLAASERWFASSTAALCVSGTHHLRTVHRASCFAQQPGGIGITVNGFGFTVQGSPWRWSPKVGHESSWRHLTGGC